ncbi:GntR family transcriptional regulator [Micromonospora lupini]|uniref:Transcriptional regulator, GntR family n=1 Tax=Micromonospora lupini str. Lupac 08 TaxID=1150864 RepID=I0L9X3_9ACTN|nr:GntR family transcriptional regulator [Micromonospora lupini]CCH20620.1 Transcriptional regulator, GntR family [Micromonospora lupini str. Lupac 08]
MIVTVEPAGEPIYLQIYRQVMHAVNTDEFPIGSPLPSTRQLARDLSVNYHTVHKAYELLRVRGIVEMTPRGRALVRRPDPLGPPDEWFAEWDRRCATLAAEAIAVGVSRGEILRRWRGLLDGAPAEA